MKKSIKLFIFIFLSFFTTYTYSQDLRNESPFFHSKLEEFKVWYDSTGFKQVIQIDSLTVKKDKIILSFGSHIEDMDSLAAAWCSLKKKYNSKIEHALYKELFNRFIFNMEIGKDSAILEIRGKNAILFNIKVSFDGELVVNEIFNPCQTMGNSSITFNLNEISCIGNDSTLNLKDSLSIIRRKISSYLQNYYKNYRTFFHPANIEIIEDNRDVLTLEVTAIDKLILKDVREYYEYHYVNIEIQKELDEIILDINLMAKYGPGLVFVPRKNNYKDMVPKYSYYVGQFEKKLNNNIIKILSN